MTALGALALLLVVSYVGGVLVGGQRLPGRGLASGAEWLVAGFLAGPVLGVVGPETLDLFAPVAQVAIGWLCVDAGLTYGRALGRPLRLSSALLGNAAALLTAGTVALGVWIWARHHPLGITGPGLGGRELLGLALASGAVAAETTQAVFAWAAQRCRAEGPLFRRLAEMSAADDLIPVLGAAVVFALEPVRTARGELPLLFGVAAHLAVGAVLGLVTAIMLGRTFRVGVYRGVALGMTLIATGLSVRIGVSPVAVLFTMGLTVASLSPLGSRIRRRLRSEQFALLPVLLFAGALATFQGWVAGWPWHWW